MTAAEVVVVGGGYAGVEVAMVLAEQLGGRARLKLVTADSDILVTSTSGQREAAWAALRDRGVAVLAGAQVTEMRKAAAAGGGSSSSNGVSGAGLSSSSSNGSSSASSSSSSSSSSEGGPDLKKRLVYVKDKDGQVEVSSGTHLTSSLS